MIKLNESKSNNIPINDNHQLWCELLGTWITPKQYKEIEVKWNHIFKDSIKINDYSKVEKKYGIYLDWIRESIGASKSKKTNESTQVSDVNTGRPTDTSITVKKKKNEMNESYYYAEMTKKEYDSIKSDIKSKGLKIKSRSEKVQTGPNTGLLGVEFSGSKDELKKIAPKEEWNYIMDESVDMNEGIEDNKWNKETNDTYNFFSGNYFSMLSIQSNMKDGITGIYYIINSTANKGEVVSGTISCDQSNVDKKLEKLKKEITDMINRCKKSGKKLTKLNESVINESVSTNAKNFSIMYSALERRAGKSKRDSDYLDKIDNMMMDKLPGLSDDPAKDFDKLDKATQKKVFDYTSQLSGIDKRFINESVINESSKKVVTAKELQVGSKYRRKSNSPIRTVTKIVETSNLLIVHYSLDNGQVSNTTYSPNEVVGIPVGSVNESLDMTEVDNLNTDIRTLYSDPVIPDQSLPLQSTEVPLTKIDDSSKYDDPKFINILNILKSSGYSNAKFYGTEGYYIPDLNKQGEPVLVRLVCRTISEGFKVNVIGGLYDSETTKIFKKQFNKATMLANKLNSMLMDDLGMNEMIDVSGYIIDEEEEISTISEAWEPNTIVVEYYNNGSGNFDLSFNSKESNNVKELKKLLDKLQKKGKIEGYLSSPTKIQVIDIDGNLSRKELISELREIYANINDRSGKSLL